MITHGHHIPQIERHLDLRCWIALAASVMAELSTLLGKDDVKYYETASYLTDNDLLNKLHLDPDTEHYTDWGLHTDSVVLKHPPPLKPQRTAAQRGGVSHQQTEKQRYMLNPPDYKYVNSMFGYVSLFPLLLEQLDYDSPSLGKMLHDMRDPELLWSNYGLRSLSKNSPMYMKRNTDHDPPYWRGPIWININYLAVKALRHYGKMNGPHAETARKIYGELRDNLIKISLGNTSALVTSGSSMMIPRARVRDVIHLLAGVVLSFCLWPNSSKAIRSPCCEFLL